MQLSKLSTFVSYDLEPNEQRAAYTFNSAQLAGIQNLIAAAAEELMVARLGEDDLSVDSIKRSAYLQGQIALGKHLLELHDSLRIVEDNSNV